MSRPTLLGVAFVAVATTAYAAPHPHQHAFIPDSNSAAVTVVNADTSKLETTIPVGVTPVHSAVSADESFVAVANEGSGSVSIIDTATLTVTQTWPGLNKPDGIALDAAGAFAYIAENGSTSLTKDVAKLDLSNGTITRSPVLSTMRNVALHPTQSLAYATNANRVTVVDTGTMAIVTHINTGTGTTPGAMVVDATNQYLYVVYRNTGTLGVIDINPASGTFNQIVNTITVGTGPRAVAYGRVGNDGFQRVFVTNVTSKTVSVIDPDPASSNFWTVIHTATLSFGPEGVSIDPDGTKVYVTSASSGLMQVLGAYRGWKSFTSTIGGGHKGNSPYWFTSPPAASSANGTASFAISRLRCNNTTQSLVAEVLLGGTNTWDCNGVVASAPGDKMSVGLWGTATSNGPTSVSSSGMTVTQTACRNEATNAQASCNVLSACIPYSQTAFNCEALGAFGQATGSFATTTGQAVHAEFSGKLDN